MHPRDPPPPRPLPLNLFSCLLRGSHNKVNVCFLRCNGACVSPGLSPGKQERKS